MKLHNVTPIKYDINEELRLMTTERLLRELSENVTQMVASWYLLNESTNQYEINEYLVNEGIKDILKNGISKVNDAVAKGYSDIDAVKTKVLQNLKGQADPGIMSKLGAITKKNAKFIKPAVMVAIVGASLLGMDTASASEALNQIDQMGASELQQYSELLKTEVGGYEDGVGFPGQENNGEGKQTILDVLQYAQKQGADTAEISKALQNLKIDGMSAQEFAAQAEQSGAATEAKERILDALRGTQNNTPAASAKSGAQTVTTRVNDPQDIQNMQNVSKELSSKI